MREQARVLAQQADPPLPGGHGATWRGRGGKHPLTQHHSTAARLDQAGDHLEQRCLACTRWPEQSQSFAGPHL